MSKFHQTRSLTQEFAKFRLVTRMMNPPPPSPSPPPPPFQPPHAPPLPPSRNFPMEPGSANPFPHLPAPLNFPIGHAPQDPSSEFVPPPTDFLDPPSPPHPPPPTLAPPPATQGAELDELSLSPLPSSTPPHLRQLEDEFHVTPPSPEPVRSPNFPIGHPSPPIKPPLTPKRIPPWAQPARFPHSPSPSFNPHLSPRPLRALSPLPARVDPPDPIPSPSAPPPPQLTGRRLSQIPRKQLFKPPAPPPSLEPPPPPPPAKLSDRPARYDAAARITQQSLPRAYSKKQNKQN